MPKADPKFSEGARLERAAFRAVLRRRISRTPINDYDRAVVLTTLLEWVLERQSRYDGKAGGLGKHKQKVSRS